MSKSESKYSVHKLEFLCLKWAITDQFHEYLYGNTFDVYTDSNPLTYVLSTAKLDAMGHMWIARLATHNFGIYYKSEKSNADALLRIDWEKCDKTVWVKSVQAKVAATKVGDLANIEMISCSLQAVESFLTIPSKTSVISKAITRLSNSSCMTCPEPGSFELETVLNADDSDYPALATRQLESKLIPKCMTIQDWIEAQSRDKIISDIVHLFKSKKLCCCKISENDKNEIKQFIKQCN